MMFHIKNPAIARVIINKDNKILRLTNTRDRGRPPNIRMNKVKDISGYRFTSIEKQSWLFS